MNAPIKPLSAALLAAAVDAALREPRSVPYARILLVETRWCTVTEAEDISFVRGIPTQLISEADLAATLEATGDDYGVCDYSAFLTPDAHYDQSHLLELDFRFDTTREIEEILRSVVTVTPCAGDFQYWYTADVVRNHGHTMLEKLICPVEYHGSWNLRGGVQIQVRDGAITIVCGRYTSSDKELEIIPLLVRKYGVRVKTIQLRERASRLLKRAAELEERAIYFEHLGAGTQWNGQTQTPEN